MNEQQNSQSAPVALEELNDQAITTTNGQLSLLDFGGFDDPLMTVFRVTDKLNADSKLIRQSVRVGKRSEVAKELELVGKDNRDKLDAAILAQRDTMKTLMVAQMNKMSSDPSWTGGGMVVAKSAKNGNKRVTFELVSATRPDKMTDEGLAHYLSLYTKKEVTVEEVREMRRREVAHLDAHDVTVTSRAA